MLKHVCAATHRAQPCSMQPPSPCPSQGPLSHRPWPSCSTLYALVKDGRRIHTGGLLQGFDAATWMVIALQVGAALGRRYCRSCIELLLGMLALMTRRWPSPARCGTLGCTQPLPTQPHTRKPHPHARPTSHTRHPHPPLPCPRCLAAWSPAWWSSTATTF